MISAKAVRWTETNIRNACMSLRQTWHLIDISFFVLSHSYLNNSISVYSAVDPQVIHGTFENPREPKLKVYNFTECCPNITERGYYARKTSRMRNDCSQKIVTSLLVDKI